MSDEESGLRRSVPRAVEHDGGAAAVARLLAVQGRAVASRNDRVGKNLLCTIIPRSAVGTGEMNITTTAIPPGAVLDVDLFRSGSPASAAYIYLPEDMTQTVFYGPDIVCDETRLVGLRQDAPSKEGEPVVLTVTGWDSTKTP